MKYLTTTEAYSVELALRLAAKQYAEDEQKMRGLKAVRLAEQFKFQKEEAERLASMVEAFDGIALYTNREAKS
jgi:hypothetical protein